MEKVWASRCHWTWTTSTSLSGEGGRPEHPRQVQGRGGSGQRADDDDEQRHRDRGHGGREQHDPLGTAQPDTTDVLHRERRSSSSSSRYDQVMPDQVIAGPGHAGPATIAGPGRRRTSVMPDQVMPDQRHAGPRDSRTRSCRTRTARTTSRRTRSSPDQRDAGPVRAVLRAPAAQARRRTPCRGRRPHRVTCLAVDGDVDRTTRELQGTDTRGDREGLRRVRRGGGVLGRRQVDQARTLLRRGGAGDRPQPSPSAAP